MAKTIKEVAIENKIKEIKSVTLELGEVSGVVHEYMTDCWKFYRKKDPLFEKSELLIEETEAITYCTSCEKTYRTVDYGRTCPHCKSDKTYLLRGDECNIKEIEAK